MFDISSFFILLNNTPRVYGLLLPPKKPKHRYHYHHYLELQRSFSRCHVPFHDMILLPHSAKSYAAIPPAQRYHPYSSPPKNKTHSLLVPPQNHMVP